MRRTSFAGMQCSLARGLDRMGDWWSPLIVRDLFAGIVRFDDLVEDLGISRNLLTARLEALVASELVERRAYQTRPPRFEYVLSDAGKELIPVIIALTGWGDRWAQPKQGAPVEFFHKSCGRKFEAQITCSGCCEKIDAASVALMPGPGGMATHGTKVLARRLRNPPSKGSDANDAKSGRSAHAAKRSAAIKKS